MSARTRIPMPKFKSIQEEAEWWDKTDTSLWMTEDDLIEVPPGSIVLAEDRCPTCYGRRRVRRFNLNVADGRVTVRRVKGYHCPRCKTTVPARSVEREIPRLEKAASKMMSL